MFSAYLVVRKCLIVTICFVTFGISSELATNTSTDVLDVTCYDEIGCLETTSEWFQLSRLFNPKPYSRKQINTTFTLVTSLNQTEDIQVVVRDSSLKYFQPKHPLKVIIHGYFNSGNTSWVEALVNAILENGSYNVLIVDWSAGSYSFYPQSATNARLVGLEVAYLLEFLIKHGIVTSKQIHIIGHSLGAHVAGYVGERIPNIGKITGLDPAGPMFQSMPLRIRLDPSDANFVEVLHTDPGTSLVSGYGTAESCGHVDIFANDKTTQQPGCDGALFKGGPLLDAENIFEAAIKHLGSIVTFKQKLNISSKNIFQEVWNDPCKVSCSHSRAVKYYIEAISNSNCKFIAFKCASFEDFQKGLCTDCGLDGRNCYALTLEAPSSCELYAYSRQSKLNTMYFKTNNHAPFCSVMYAIKMHMSAEDKLLLATDVKIYLRISGEKGELGEFALNEGESIKLTPNQTVISVISRSIDIGKATEVTLKWSNVDRNIFTEMLRSLENYLYLTKITVQNLGMLPQQVPIELCIYKKTLVEISQNEEVIFKAENCQQ